MTITAAGQLWNKDQDFFHLLIHHVERIPANSKWAHRASGPRSAIFRTLEQTKDEKFINPTNPSQLSGQDFETLEQASGN